MGRAKLGPASPMNGHRASRNAELNKKYNTGQPHLRKVCPMNGEIVVSQSQFNYFEDLCRTPHADIEKDKAIYDNEYQFPNHYRMAIQVISPLSPAEESCWTQGVLFDENGNELGCTEVGESFGGEYCVSYNGYDYVVTIKREREKFAQVAWVADDILSLRPNWTLDQAEEFLQDNEGQIQDIMIERGWDAIDSLLPPKEE